MEGPFLLIPSCSLSTLYTLSCTSRTGRHTEGQYHITNLSPVQCLLPPSPSISRRRNSLLLSRGQKSQMKGIKYLGTPTLSLALLLCLCSHQSEQLIHAYQTSRLVHWYYLEQEFHPSFLLVTQLTVASMYVCSTEARIKPGKTKIQIMRCDLHMLWSRDGLKEFLLCCILPSYLTSDIALRPALCLNTNCSSHYKSNGFPKSFFISKRSIVCPGHTWLRADIKSNQSQRFSRSLLSSDFLFQSSSQTFLV